MEVSKLLQANHMVCIMDEVNEIPGITPEMWNTIDASIVEITIILAAFLTAVKAKIRSCISQMTLQIVLEVIQDKVFDRKEPKDAELRELQTKIDIHL